MKQIKFDKLEIGDRYWSFYISIGRMEFERKKVSSNSYIYSNDSNKIVHEEEFSHTYVYVTNKLYEKRIK